MLCQKRDVVAGPTPLRSSLIDRFQSMRASLPPFAASRVNSQSAGQTRHLLTRLLLAQNFLARAERLLLQCSASHRSSHSTASIWLEPKLNFRRSPIRQLRRGYAGQRCLKLSARSTSMSLRHFGASSCYATQYPVIAVLTASSTVNLKTPVYQCGEAQRIPNIEISMHAEFFGVLAAARVGRPSQIRSGHLVRGA